MRAVSVAFTPASVVMARTRTSYDCALVSPVIVFEVAVSARVAPDCAQPVPSLNSTTYPRMRPPFADEGAAQFSAIWPLPSVAVNDCGAVGTPEPICPTSTATSVDPTALVA